MKTKNKIEHKLTLLKGDIVLALLFIGLLLVITSCSTKNYGCYDFGYEYQDSDNSTDLSEQECIIEPSKASQSCVEH